MRGEGEGKREKGEGRGGERVRGRGEKVRGRGERECICSKIKEEKRGKREI